jgi:hypothetical protein
MTNDTFEITQEDLDYLQKVKLHIATPCYGGMCGADYSMSVFRFINMAASLGLQVSIQQLSNESLITRARNLLADHFLKETDGTHLMFIDADISFEPIDIIKLILRKKEIVGGAYPIKQINWETILKNKDSIDSVEGLMYSSSSYVVNLPQYTVEKSVLLGGKIELDNGLLEVTGLGTGFVLIQREVFEKMEKYYDNDWFLYEDKKVHLFFDTAIEEQTREYLSEDYFFTRRWLQLGGFVWIEPTVSLIHTGYYRFNGGPLALNSVKLEENKEESIDE